MFTYHLTRYSPVLTSTKYQSMGPTTLKQTDGIEPTRYRYFGHGGTPNLAKIFLVLINFCVNVTTSHLLPPDDASIKKNVLIILKFHLAHRLRGRFH